MEATLRNIEKDIEDLFDGLPNQEINANLLNTAIKKAHPEVRFGTFIIEESKAISLGALSAHRIRYSIESEGKSVGQYECRFNAAYFIGDEETYCLELEQLIRFR